MAEEAEIGKSTILDRDGHGDRAVALTSTDIGARSGHPTSQADSRSEIPSRTVCRVISRDEMSLPIGHLQILPQRK
jgi:hypothetical protein